ACATLSATHTAHACAVLPRVAHARFAPRCVGVRPCARTARGLSTQSDTMPPRPNENDVRSLQRRAEQAIRGAKPREYVVRLLEQLVAVAEESSDAARFAHRHLAELCLEESPWRSALHLRRVIQQDPDDDIAQALMGLCQALQANFRSAVAAYRRAVALAPG